ncbi:M16 family metallopeptidase [Anaplasma capra]|uniref:M16 family metallopeptidase n=1 Tax=Anaplasma capra TaxID=1562740 RepID=UPI0021D60A9F|nr:pitrilysin family protein [Anaplasma capra]MCU7611287.1 insulinase family protein [Anaplasma capra]MCU7612716.1 insulinase family protein [Anaplasma capra]
MRVAELDNGMKVYVIPDNRFPIVLHMLVYKVGGMDDPPGLSGIAHFLEHMMFTGTKNVKNFSEIIGRLGGKFNALTSNAYTAYYELVGKQHLPLMMEMEADRMRNLDLTTEYMERERNVVLEERKMRTEATPRGLLDEEAVNAFYRNGYGRPVIGWEHEIANYDMSSVEAFYRKYYNPSNAILLVAGDVDFDEVMELSKAYYGGIKNNDQAAERKTDVKLEPPHRAGMVLKMESAFVADPEMFMLYRTPSVTQDASLRGYYAASLAADVLAGDEFGVLYDELVRKQRVATSVSVSYGAKELSSGAVSIDIRLSPGISPEVARREVGHVVEQLIASGVSEQSVENAKYRSMARVVYDLDGIEDRAWFYAGLLAIESPTIAMENVVDVIKGIKAEEVNAALKGIFANPAVEGHLLPK